MTSFVDDNGNYLDYEGQDFGLTKQAATWMDFKIKGDFSVDFTLPNTAKNREALQYFGPQQIDSPAFPSIVFNVIRNGNYIARGYISIRSFEATKINCFFLSGNSNWFNSFAFNLKEIDYPDRFTIDADDIDGRKAATEGILFPVVNWWAEDKHRNTVFAQWDNERQTGFPPFSEFHPCLYLHTIVEEMAQYAGAKVSGDLISDPLFRKMIITPDGPEIFWPDWEVTRSRTKCFLQFPAYSYDDTVDPQVVRWGKLEGSTLFNQDNYSFLVGKTAVYRIILNMYCGTVGISLQPSLYINGVFDSNLTLFGNELNAEYLRVLNRGDYVQIFIERTVGTGSYRLNRATPANESNVTFEIFKPVGTVIQPDTSGAWTPLTCKVPPGAITPSMKATELIKFLCIYFGAVCSYDESSKTLSLNKMSRMTRDEDWSDYFVSAKVVHQKAAAHNYIKFQEVDDADIKSYNESVKIGYGGGDIQSDNDTEFERIIYTIPFGPSYDNVPSLDVSWRWFMPFIKFYELNLQETTTYSGVTSAVDASGATVGQFTSTWQSQIDANESVFYVKSNSGYYTGFAALVSSPTGTTNPRLGMIYSATDAGTIYRYSVSKVKAGHRLLICHPNTAIADAGGSNFYVRSSSSGSLGTTAAIVWFDKPKMDLNIDANRESLAIDPIGTRDYNLNTGERFHSQIESIYSAPKIEALMLLPEKVFYGFDFTSFVYLKTKDINGYFFVQKIDNYKDSLTPVKVELLSID